LEQRFLCPIDPKSNFPVALAKTPIHHPINYSKHSNVSSTLSFARNHPSFLKPSLAHTSVLDQQNQNISPAQKELLLWHYCLGHLSFKHFQWLMKPRDTSTPKLHHISIQCIIPKHINSSTCQLPLCASCEIAKAKRRSNNAISNRHNQELTIRANHLIPGDCVSIHQYESSVRGRIHGSKHRETFGNSYIGGTIFYDHASGFIRCVHQSSLRASNTIVAKNIFEREAKFFGALVSSYHGDNGVFKSKDFSKSIQLLDQSIRLSGVGAHHQNGVAERAIRTITEKARTMMHHSNRHWPEHFSVDTWPYALDYST
jgi:hypothetical protein